MQTRDFFSHHYKMTPEQLISIYPWLDHMLAKTLLKMHDEGKLQGYIDAMGERDEPAYSCQTSITVENNPSQGEQTE